MRERRKIRTLEYLRKNTTNYCSYVKFITHIHSENARAHDREILKQIVHFLSGGNIQDTYYTPLAHQIPVTRAWSMRSNSYGPPPQNVQNIAFITIDKSKKCKFRQYPNAVPARPSAARNSLAAKKIAQWDTICPRLGQSMKKLWWFWSAEQSPQYFSWNCMGSYGFELQAALRKTSGLFLNWFSWVPVGSVGSYVPTQNPPLTTKWRGGTYAPPPPPTFFALSFLMDFFFDAVGNMVPSLVNCRECPICCSTRDNSEKHFFLPYHHLLWAL